jgi:hypothetical protein
LGPPSGTMKALVALALTATKIHGPLLQILALLTRVRQARMIISCRVEIYRLGRLNGRLDLLQVKILVLLGRQRNKRLDYKICSLKLKSFITKFLI